MLTIFRRTTTLAAATLILGTVIPPALADNLTGEGDVVGASTPTVDLGSICPGASQFGSFGFTLQRSGNSTSSQVWGNSATVTIAPASSQFVRGAGTVTLGSLTTATPGNWVTGSTSADNGKTVDAGDASVTVAVPDEPTATTGSVTFSYNASGPGFSTTTVNRSTTVVVTWTVGDCNTDSTPPSVDYTLDPATPTGDNGWYTGDVSIDWTVADAESASSTTGCADGTLSTDGSATYSCTATSAGGTTGPVDVTLKRDATAPTVTPAVAGTLGDNGWYTGDVSVHWDYDDATSGVGTSSGCDDATVDEDTTGDTFTCTVTDAAGNATTSSTTVQRDATAPVITRTVSGTLGDNGWYTSDVSVTWGVTDATSDLATTTGCDPVVVTADTDDVSFTCSAQDNAGNTASDTATVQRDASAPEITFTRSGLEGENGWFVGPVDLAWTVTDGGSGVADTSGCGPVTVNGDTSGTGVTCSAADAAGNGASATATIRKDATAPAVSPSVAGPLGDNGWFVGDASVTWNVSDATSGVGSAVGCDPATVSVDTLGDSFTCSVKDEAGNAASGSVTVSRDATAPTVLFTAGPTDGATYDFGDPIPVAACDASDATSGVSPAGCTVTGGGTGVGSHSLTASAADNAGNTGLASSSYTVRAWRLDGFYKPVNMGTNVVNTVKAGATVPLKFNVYKGGVPLTSGIGATFSAKKAACDGSDIPDAVEEFATTGSTALRYDATGQQWVQNWATPSSGKGSCYRVSLTTADGSTITAGFQLK